MEQELVSGANSMVLFKEKKFQIQSQFIDQKVVTIVIIDGQVRQRVEKEVDEELKSSDAYNRIQKVLNTQHREIELKIRSKAKQKEKEDGAAEAEDEKPIPVEPPKKRGLLDSILRRKS